MKQNETFEILFESHTHPMLCLSDGANLSEHLTIENSPILFGCRTGICGTCLVEVLSDYPGSPPPPKEDERELLAILAPNNPKARLACQLRATCNLKIQQLTG